MSKHCNANAAAGVNTSKSTLSYGARRAQRSYTQAGQAGIMDGKWIWIVTAALVLGTSSVRADENKGDDEQDAAEVTIRLMDASEARRPEAVTAEIPIPVSLPESAALGIETAKEARNGRETGRARADSARENAENMADEARENRENRGRSEDARPDHVPERPDRPQSPGG
jgi:hypothetical protein